MVRTTEAGGSWACVGRQALIRIPPEAGTPTSRSVGLRLKSRLQAVRAIPAHSVGLECSGWAPARPRRIGLCLPQPSREGMSFAINGPAEGLVGLSSSHPGGANVVRVGEAVRFLG